MTSDERVMNLDDSPEIDVVLGGRHFILQQQRFGLIQKILAISDRIEEAVTQEPDESDTDYQIRVYRERWEDTVPAFAYIFGFEKPDTEEGQAILTHLHAYLSIPKAIKIWERWYSINQIDDFFVRGGRILMKPWMVEAYQKAKQEALQKVIEPVEVNS